METMEVLVYMHIYKNWPVEVHIYKLLWHIEWPNPSQYEVADHIKTPYQYKYITICSYYYSNIVHLTDHRADQLMKYRLSLCHLNMIFQL